MKKNELSPRQTWSAVGSMALCVSMLIAAEFMPVSLLTPLARDLRATEGMAGCFLGSDAPRGGDSNLAMAEPAVDGAPNDQPCRKAFWAAEATPCRLCDDWSHAHLRRGICGFHIPATVP